MCENPLSPELKDALIADQGRPLGLPSRLSIDHIAAALAANGAGRSGSRATDRPRRYLSTITALVLSEARTKEELHA